MFICLPDWVISYFQSLNNFIHQWLSLRVGADLQDLFFATFWLNQNIDRGLGGHVACLKLARETPIYRIFLFIFFGTCIAQIVHNANINASFEAAELACSFTSSRICDVTSS
jgi:hypothetical protein